MAAFRSPPERLLRPIVQALSAHGRQSMTTRIQTSGRRMYRAAVCKELGKPLVIENLPAAADKLKSSQVRVAVHCCGINFADILMSIGKYQQKPALPAVLGSEVAGEVIETGEGVTNVTKGDRVVGIAPFGGGFSEECIVPQEVLWKIPSNFGFEKAAAMTVSYGTAYVGLTHQGNIKAGQTVLVTAAAGALGLATVDLAANVFGAKVIGASRGDKLQVVQEIGATVTIDYTKESIKDKVKEATGGRGANVIMEAVGGDVFKECLKSIAWGGVIIPVGFASGDIPQIPANILLVKNCSAAGLYWGAHMKENPELLTESVNKTLEFIEQGKLKGPHVSAVFELEQIQQCDRCQRNAPDSKANYDVLHPVKVVPRAWHVVGIDARTLSSKGNRYLLTQTDYFTKYIEAIPIPDKTAINVAKALFSTYCRHGAPVQIISDQGREFLNQVSEELLAKFDVNHRITSAYHPQSNGLDERTNQSRTLRKVIDDNHETWDEHIEGPPSLH